MKKSFKIILTAFIVFFLFISNSNAVAQRKKICGYTLNATEEKSDKTTFNLGASITYYASDILYIGWDHKEWGGTGVLSSIVETSNSKKVFMESTVKEDLLKGVCPKYVYVDFKGAFNMTSEICFDNSGTYCSNLSTTGRDFKNELGHGTLTSELRDDVKKFFDNYEITEANILDENFDLASDVKEKFIAEVIRKDIFDGFEIENEYELYAYIGNMEEFEKGFEKLETKLETLTQSIIKNKTDEHNDGKITEDELNDVKEQIMEQISAITGNLEEVKEDINSGNKQLTSNIKFDFSINENDPCNSILGSTDKNKKQPAYYLQFLFNLIKYAAIVLLFVLTIVEFAKATVSNNQDAMKKAIQNTVKRLIIAVIIFLLPILIEFALKLLGVYSPSTCGIS